MAANPSNIFLSGSLWDLAERAQVITFIGAGGKTTCLQTITKEIESAGLQVVATTTTKVFPASCLNIWQDPDNPPPREKGQTYFWYAQNEEESGKWIGPTLRTVDKAIARDRDLFETITYYKRFWVIEGDGARGHRLKCWRSHEPQIPEQTGWGVLVLDGGLWGRVLEAEQLHHPANCPDLLGHLWQAETAWRYFRKSPVFAPQYSQMSWAILMNFHSPIAGHQSPPGPFRPLDCLQGLVTEWAENQREKAENIKPRHLRLAAGNAKEGKIQWCDLW